MPPSSSYTTTWFVVPLPRSTPGDETPGRHDQKTKPNAGIYHAAFDPDSTKVWCAFVCALYEELEQVREIPANATFPLTHVWTRRKPTPALHRLRKKRTCLRKRADRLRSLSDRRIDLPTSVIINILARHSVKDSLENGPPHFHHCYQHPCLTLRQRQLTPREGTATAPAPCKQVPIPVSASG